MTRAVDHQWQSRENGHSAETPPKEVSIPAKCALPAHPIGAGSGTYDRTEAARRLWQSCRAIEDTHAEAYLRARALHRCRFPALRFHPALNYRDSEPEPWPRGGRAGPANRLRRYPALVAAVTGDDGALASIHRTWLDPSRPAKAPVAQPRKALGRVHGFAVRFGHYAHTLLVGEGIETVLSLVTAMPDIPAAAALSAGSLGSFAPPSVTTRLVIARDNDPEGGRAAERLLRRCQDMGIAATVIVPERGDFNDDLTAIGPQALAARIAPLLAAAGAKDEPP